MSASCAPRQVHAELEWRLLNRNTRSRSITSFSALILWHDEDRNGVGRRSPARS